MLLTLRNFILSIQLVKAVYGKLKKGENFTWWYFAKEEKKIEKVFNDISDKPKIARIWNSFLNMKILYCLKNITAPGDIF